MLNPMRFLSLDLIAGYCVDPGMYEILRNSGILLVGFIWSPLIDQVDWSETSSGNRCELILLD
jgi:hypothetical protein